MTLFTQQYPATLARQERNIPLVLLHGWGLNHHVWSAVAEQLQTQRPVMSLDLPGHGRSSMPTTGYALQDVTAMIASSIKHAYAGKKVILLGWSLGGLLAMTLAIHQPELLAGLVLLSSTPRFVKDSDWPYGMSAEVLAGFARELEKDYQSTVQRFLALQSMGSLRAKQEIQFLRQALLDEQHAPQAEALAGGLRLLQDVDMRTEVKHIHCPTLIINGERDRLVNPDSGTLLSQWIPQAKHVLIKGAGHAPFISHQETFVELVERFCNKHG